MLDKIWYLRVTRCLKFECWNTLCLHDSMCRLIHRTDLGRYGRKWQAPPPACSALAVRATASWTPPAPARTWRVRRTLRPARGCGDAVRVLAGAAVPLVTPWVVPCSCACPPPATRSGRRASSHAAPAPPATRQNNHNVSWNKEFTVQIMYFKWLKNN